MLVKALTFFPYYFSLTWFALIRGLGITLSIDMACDEAGHVLLKDAGHMNQISPFSDFTITSPLLLTCNLR